MNFSWDWTYGLIFGLQHEAVIVTAVDEFEDEEDILVSSWNLCLGPVSFRVLFI